MDNCYRYVCLFAKVYNVCMLYFKLLYQMINYVWMISSGMDIVKAAFMIVYTFRSCTSTTRITPSTRALA